MALKGIAMASEKDLEDDKADVNRNVPVQRSDSDLLTSIEEETHSFVIRLWPEPRDSVHSTAEWRGWVQHVQDGERHYFRDLAEIGHIVASHLSEMPLA